MPELPEVETVKLQLQKHLVGQTLLRIEPLHKKSVVGNPTLVEGKKVTDIDRKGKMLIIYLGDKLSLAIHLKMSGQLILVRVRGEGGRGKGDEEGGKQEERIVGGHPTQDWVGELPSSHTRAILHFKSGDIIYFNDQRIFGWIKILTNEELLKTPYLKTLGKEIWDLSDEEFYYLIRRRKRRIKEVIMQPDVVSGIGNIYANEGLWEASLNPTKEAKTLTLKEAVKLRAALIKVLQEGIKYGGATSPDSKYLNLFGLGGTYQDHFRVYSREGKPCLRCQTKIDRIVINARGSYYCPKCQKFKLK